MKRVALIAPIAAFFVIACIWIAVDRRATHHAFDHFSSANTGSEGLSLAREYLARRGHRVRVFTRIGAIAGAEHDAVVFRLTREGSQPEVREITTKGGAKEETRVEPLKLAHEDEAFIRRGGRLVIGATEKLLGVDGTPIAVAEKVFPVWPGIDEVTLPEPRAFARLRSRMHAVMIAGAKVTIARERIGSGELLVVATPELFRNSSIDASKRLDLLVALAGETRPVYFDEVPHGLVSDDGMLALMKEWRLGPLLLLLAMLCVLVFWRNARRIGPPEDDYRDTRSDAADLVRSVGALYRRSTTDAEALAMYHGALTRSVAAQTGLRGDALHKRIAELTGDMPVPESIDGDAAFQRTLSTINEAFRRVQSHRGIRGDSDANHR